VNVRWANHSMFDVRCWVLDVSLVHLRVLAFENYFKADASDRCLVASKRSEDGRREAIIPHHARLEVAGRFYL